jgi:UPF0716 protein FxsA
MLRKSARVLIGTAIVEFALLALLVTQLGVPLTAVIALVVGGTALGMFLSMRQVGQLVAPSRRRSSAPPDASTSAAEVANSVSDGAMRAAAGLLLAFPGLVTGALGLALLVPPIRRALEPVLWARFSRLLPVDFTATGTGPAGASFHDLFSQETGSSPFGPGTGRPRRGTVVDVDVASTEPDSSGNPSSAPPELR